MGEHCLFRVRHEQQFAGYQAKLATAAEKQSTTATGKSIQYGLQRRKNPARTIPDQRRLPVKLSFTDRAGLAAPGSDCGLSPNAIANLLLEPDGRARFARLQAARDGAARERQRTITPDRFPDLSEPVVAPANGQPCSPASNRLGICFRT